MKTIILKGRKIYGGVAEGEALVMKGGLGGMGVFDVESGKVIGKQDGRVDGLPWDYSVKIGEVESFGCDVFEGETFAGRLYCVLPLRPEDRNAVRLAAVRVNGCDEDLLSIPRLSLLVEKPVAGSGGSGDGSGSGSDKKLSAQFTKLCGVKPEPICSWVFNQWCDCMGGTFTCLGEPGGGNPATCDLP